MRSTVRSPKGRIICALLLIAAALPSASAAFGLMGIANAGSTTEDVAMGATAGVSASASGPTASGEQAGGSVQTPMQAGPGAGKPGASNPSAGTGAAAASKGHHANTSDPSGSGSLDPSAGTIIPSAPGDEAVPEGTGPDANRSDGLDPSAGTIMPAAPDASEAALPNPLLALDTLDPLLRAGVPASPAEVPAPSASASAPTATGDPPGFSWKFKRYNDFECAIVGYDYAPGGIVKGTVHVPAVDPDNPKQKVIVMALVLDTAGAVVPNYYKDLHCKIDFTGATNLQSFETQAFEGSGLTGALDFSKCTNLKDIASKAFRNSPGITSLALPQGMRSIWHDAFAGCTGLTGTLTLPDALKTLGYSAFTGAQFTGLKFNKGTSQLTSIGDDTFNGSHIGSVPDTDILDFPAGITSIGNKAFYNNDIRLLTFASASNSFSVGDEAFAANRLQASPTNYKRITHLGTRCFASNPIKGVVNLTQYEEAYPTFEQVFSGCTGITGFVIPKEWKIIPDNAFNYLSGLQEVTMAEGTQLQSIGQFAFYDCPSLQTVQLNGAPLRDGKPGDDPGLATRLAVGEGSFGLDKNLKTVFVGDGIDPGSTVTIGPRAFQNCSQLMFFDIPGDIAPGGGSKPATINVNIGDSAFENTNLGAFPGPDGKPLGYLPLDRRNIIKIGAAAFKNANLQAVKLPPTLTKVGGEAFANNHMTSLELPNNPALDAPGAVGANVLAKQTSDKSVLYGTAGSSLYQKSNFVLSEMGLRFGLDVGRISSAAFYPTGATVPQKPENTDWKTTGLARFATNGDPAPPGSSPTFNYGYEVWREGGTASLSKGDVTLSSLKEGVPYTLHYYDGNWSNPMSFTQWVQAWSFPQESYYGTENFGMATPSGYHMVNKVYGSDPDEKDAGWRAGAGPTGGKPWRPSQQQADDVHGFDFYNRFIGNTYKVVFNNNFDQMLFQDSSLGLYQDGAWKPNPQYVKGAMADMPNMKYGVEAKTPLTRNAFTMGSYVFEGWALNSVIKPANRHEGVNFFPDGYTISTPDPPPKDGGTINLYAQWKPVDISSDPVALGSILIPSSIEMQQDGAYLWSKTPARDPARDTHAVSISAIQGVPGAAWPKGIKYDVLVKGGVPDSPLNLTRFADDGVEIRPIDILKTKDGPPYRPAPDSAHNPTVALMTLTPSNTTEVSDAFYLKSRDKAWDFTPNASYSGTMTFVLRQVGP